MRPVHIFVFHWHSSATSYDMHMRNFFGIDVNYLNRDTYFFDVYFFFELVLKGEKS